MCANRMVPSRSEIAAANVYERFLAERGILAEASPGDNPPDWVFQVSVHGSTNESWAVEVTELHRNFKVDSDWVPERSIFVPVLEEQDRRTTLSTASDAPKAKLVRVRPGESHPKRVLSDIEPDDMILVSIDPGELSEDGRSVDSNPAEFAKIATSLAIERKVPVFRKLKEFDRRVMLLVSEFLFPPDPKVVMEVFYRTTSSDLSLIDEVCLIHEDRITVVLGSIEDFGRSSGK